MHATVKIIKNKVQRTDSEEQNRLSSVICYLLSENKGQTILEFLVALTLIIFFLMGVVVLEVYSIRNTQYAQDKSTATKLANQQIERARVVRDSEGIGVLQLLCSSPCYINDQLTPVAAIPTGNYGQSLTIESSTSTDCPLPDVTITPDPVSYKAKAFVSWSQGIIVVTPPKEIEISSCITDWR